MNLVYLQGGTFDGKTYKKNKADLSTIRIPYIDNDGKDATDVYMKVLNDNKILNGKILEIYLYHETVDG